MLEHHIKLSIISNNQINQMQYTRINTKDIPDVLNKKDQHCTGHVYLMNSDYDILLGHNKKYKNVCSFGGFASPGESLADTVLREFQEETLGTVMNSEALSELILTKSIMITRTSPKGRHYTLFCNSNAFDFDLDLINATFALKLTDPNLTADQLENDYVTIVNLKSVSAVIEQNKLDTTDINGFVVHLREINIPAYKWLISALANDELKNFY